MADQPDPRGESVILIADSEVIVRHAIADYLRHCGYTVIEAANSEEVQSVLGSADVRVDAMLCDLNVQGAVTAFQLRHWVKENRPELKTILAGNISGVAEAAAALCEDGPDLGRPYDPQGVVDYIRRLLASRERQER